LYAKVTDLASVPVGQPQDINFAYESRDAFMTQAGVRDVWVIKHSADSVTVFSPVCPHLGCHYSWDAKAHQFRCPCHDSIFAVTGKVLGGPAPRPLDTLPHKIENGELFVKWERFGVGTPRKVRV
jgi:menaquinol-cytochrome c reductase iron-sulfur subunit